MAGIYIHIPYCKQACYYCDFHFSTNSKTKTRLIDALCREIELRQKFFRDRKINTLYFGGGTPSMLDQHEIDKIISTVAIYFDLSSDAEITLEANPDDLTSQKLEEFIISGINRLSIGIQSFHQKYLELFNRAHDSKMAIKCVEDARKTGFRNISLDLIFGIPDQTIDELQSDFRQAITLQPDHISIYGLTIEKDTVFGNWYRKKKLKPLDEDKAAEQLEFIMDKMESHGFEQYEISNFCKPGFKSRHNSSYWQGIPYLGIGPSAHSYNGEFRQSNVRNNNKYISAILSNQLPSEEEKLSSKDRINEYILTRIRTSDGLDLDEFSSLFDVAFFDKKSTEIEELILHEKIIIKDHKLRLTKAGKLIADYITEKLIV